MSAFIVFPSDAAIWTIFIFKEQGTSLKPVISTLKPNYLSLLQKLVLTSIFIIQRNFSSACGEEFKMGRPPNGKTTTINGKTSGLRVSKTASVKGPATLSKGGSPTNSGIGKAQSDRSQLNFPYDIRLSGFTSIQNAVTKGTPKVSSSSNVNT